MEPEEAAQRSDGTVANQDKQIAEAGTLEERPPRGSSCELGLHLCLGTIQLAGGVLLIYLGAVGLGLGALWAFFCITPFWNFFSLVLRRPLCCPPVSGLWLLFESALLMAYSIVYAVYIFGIYEPNYTDSSSPGFCSRSFYLLAIVTVFAGLSLIYLYGTWICCACIVEGCRICSLWKWTTPGRNNSAAVAPAAKDKNRLEVLPFRTRSGREGLAILEA